MSVRFFFRHILRESRGSWTRWIFFISCLAVGVAAIVAVAGVSSSLDQAIRGESRRLLAADLVVRGRQPIPQDLMETLRRRPDLRLSETREAVTVVAVPSDSAQAGASQLVELKAVAPGYPFYGDLVTDPAAPLDQILGEERCLVAPDLLQRLDLAPGRILRIGGVDFRIAGTLLSEPDRIGNAFSLGPRVMISLAGLGRTELERFGSRIGYRLLVRLAEGASPSLLASLAEEIRGHLEEEPGYRVETFNEALPSLREGLDRVGRYLGLVALLSLLLGGIGVAQTTRAWLAGRMDAIATLRCLGLRPREVLILYLGQTALLGLAGSLVGAAAGLAVQQSVPLFLGDLLPLPPATSWQPAALGRGLALGLGVALLFSISALAAVRRVPPLRVLRRDVEPLPASIPVRMTMAAVLVLGIWLTAAVQADSLRWGALFTGGVLAAAGILSLAALLVTRALARAPRDFGSVWLRHGLAAGGRPGAATTGAIVALGLGVLFVLATALVERGLADALLGELPEDAPTAFLIDIQPDQWPEVNRLLQEQGATRIDSVPVIQARLQAVDGVTTRQLADAHPENRDRRWALTREQRLTYLTDLPEDNRVIAGELWSDPERWEVSVEAEFAGELGASLGSTLELDVQGVPVDLTVTSLREVDWRTFGINFFLVVEPGALDDAPQQRLAAARMPADREIPVQDLLAARHPNVTMLEIRQILETVGAVMERLAAGVRFLGSFTIIAGVVILGGALSASMVKRSREVALLKTLGMTRPQVLAMLSTEHAIGGTVAGIVGAAGANLLAWAVLTRGLELEWTLRPGMLFLALAATTGLAALTGLVVSWRALSRRPVEVLRQE